MLVMIRNLDTSVLRTFLSVAETTSMTGAAAALNLTQAAVSQQIKRLEELFGTQLFERDRRGMRLTIAGERLFGKARKFVALNDEIFTEMTAPAEEGEVRFGVPYDLVNSYLPPILKNFAKAFPRVKLSLVSRPSLILLEALHAGEIDLALVEDRAPAKDDEVLAIEPLVWASAKGGEAYLKRPLPVSFGSEVCVFRPAVKEALNNAGIEWWAVSEMGNEALYATVHTDLAVMPLMRSTVPPSLHVLGPSAGLPSMPAYSVCLHVHQAGSSHVADALADYIRAGLSRRKAA
jgi:DNA-binding transcriptional LysR family regulator